MKKNSLRFTLATCVLSLLCGCVPTAELVPAREPVRVVAEPAPTVSDFGFLRTANPLEYTDIAYNEWPVPSVAPRKKVERTLLIYMNGSDLESENGAGTDDLAELCAAGVDEERVNVIVFTGGAYRWHTPAISSAECELLMLRDGRLAPLAKVGDRDMGDAGTLAAFIKFGRAAFPAARTSLILWDHGGGSIAGYGADERFNSSALTLRELEFAFAKAGLDEAPLELLGFDACLMASVETAVIAAPYAEYLVASESLEPGDGWDYTALDALNDSESDSAVLAIALADAYLNASLTAPEEVSISVTRTDRAAVVMGALGALAERCAADLLSGENGGFAALTSARRGTKAFGEGSAEDVDCDMVDIASLALSLQSNYPTEVADVLETLAAAVVFNAHNSETALGGLSAYHIFGGAEDAQYTLSVYAALQMSEAYTRYQIAFAERLLRAEAAVYASRSEREASLFGSRTALYRAATPQHGTVYAAACTVNGERADALFFVPAAQREATPKLLGYRKYDGYLIQKGYEEFREGDDVVCVS